MDKYGFVYIWYDRKRKMYYIGAHWGTEDDGYICSSNRMRDAYRRRPQDFKRRVLNRFDTKHEAFSKEREWLLSVKRRNRYYNHRFDVIHWLVSEQATKSAKEKMSAAKKGRVGPRLGQSQSKETREKISNTLKGRKTSEATKAKQSAAMKGKKYSEESIRKSSLGRMKTYRLLSPEGELVIINNLREFCFENGLNYENAQALATGKYYKDKYKGWSSYQEDSMSLG